MTQNDFDFERDLSDAFAPVKMPMELQRKLLEIPQLHQQQRASWLVRLLPRPWFEGMTAISARPAFGMTTSVAAACCSLVIGLSLGLGGMLPQAQLSQQTAVAADQTAASDADSASLLYAAADFSTGLSLKGDSQ
ncbi:MAG TPA: hypothetical protein VM659_21435 [Dongiaceae bacterium]|nr:hypothetical protein [Dongiaceae bacterium]